MENISQMVNTKSSIHLIVIVQQESNYILLSDISYIN